MVGKTTTTQIIWKQCRGAITPEVLVLSFQLRTAIPCTVGHLSKSKPSRRCLAFGAKPECKREFVMPKAEEPSRRKVKPILRLRILSRKPDLYRLPLLVTLHVILQCQKPLALLGYFEHSSKFEPLLSCLVAKHYGHNCD